MSLLQNRIKRLEGFQVDDQLIVYIIKWAEPGERNHVTFGNHVIDRLDTEPEDSYLDRATEEIKRLADPNQKVITAFAWH